MKKILIRLSLCAILASCEKVIIPESAKSDAVTVFETLWQTIDKGYSFFEYKSIDWNAVYQTYRPRISNNMTDRELFNVCSEMLRVLKDGHVNLRAGFST